MNHRYEDQSEVKLLNMIKNLWPVIGSIVIIIFGYGYLNKTIEAHGRELIKNDDFHETLRTHRIEDEIHFAKLDEAIKQIPEMRNDIKMILREMKK